MLRGLAHASLLFAVAHLPGGRRAYHAVTRGLLGSQDRVLRKLQRVWPGYVRVWRDRCGLRLEGSTIDDNFRTADVIVLLISADFMDSNFCSEQEMTLALERRRSGEAVVVPVIVRACDWEDSTLGGIQALPPRSAVTSWPNKDEAWSEVARGIRREIQQLGRDR